MYKNARLGVFVRACGGVVAITGSANLLQNGGFELPSLATVSMTPTILSMDLHHFGQILDRFLSDFGLNLVCFDAG